MLENLILIENEELIEEVKKLKASNFRLAAITCENEKELYELTYHFDLDYTMKNIRIIIRKEDNLLSISGIYPAAFLIENEFQDLYGLTFQNLTIDYKGHLYLSEDGPVTPMVKQ